MRDFLRRFGVEPGGNVHEDPHGEFGGRNILYQAHEVEGIDAVLARAVPKLMEVRSQRPRPHLDDKILSGWNAMMISAFAKERRSSTSLAMRKLREPRGISCAACSGVHPMTHCCADIEMENPRSKPSWTTMRLW